MHGALCRTFYLMFLHPAAIYLICTYVPYILGSAYFCGSSHLLLLLYNLGSYFSAVPCVVRCAVRCVWCSCVLRLCTLCAPVFLIYQGPHISVVLHIYYYCYIALDRIFLLFHAWCTVPCFLSNVPASYAYVLYIHLCNSAGYAYFYVMHIYYYYYIALILLFHTLFLVPTIYNLFLYTAIYRYLQ